MDHLIIALFGVNRVNLIGWTVTGLLVLVVAAAGLLLALSPVPAWDQPPERLLLAAICVLLMGIFGVLLQTYCSLLAEKLDQQKLAAARRSIEPDEPGAIG